MAIGQGNVWKGIGNKQSINVKPKTSPQSVYKPGVYTGQQKQSIDTNVYSGHHGGSSKRKKSSSQNKEAPAQVSKAPTQIEKVQQAINKPQPQSVDPQAQARAYKQQQERKQVPGYYVEDVYNRQSRPLYESEFESKQSGYGQQDIKDNSYSTYKVYKQEPEGPKLVAKGGIESWSSVGKQLQEQKADQEAYLRGPTPQKATMNVGQAPTKQQQKEYDYFVKTTSEQPTFDYLPGVALYTAGKTAKGFVSGIFSPIRPKFYTEEIPGAYQFTKGLFTGATFEYISSQNIAETIRTNPYKTFGFVGENIGYAKGFGKTSSLISKANPINVGFGKNVKLTSFSRGGYKNLFEIKYKPSEVTFRPGDKFGVPYSELTSGPVKSGIVVSRKPASPERYADTYRAVKFKEGKPVKIIEAQVKPITMDTKAVVSRGRANVRFQQQRISKVTQRKQSQGLQGYGRKVSYTGTEKIIRYGKGRLIGTSNYLISTEFGAKLTRTGTRIKVSGKEIKTIPTGLESYERTITLGKQRNPSLKELKFYAKDTKAPARFFDATNSQLGLVTKTGYRYQLTMQKPKVPFDYSKFRAGELQKYRLDSPKVIDLGQPLKVIEQKPIVAEPIKIQKGFRPGMKEKLIARIKARQEAPVQVGKEVQVYQRSPKQEVLTPLPPPVSKPVVYPYEESYISINPKIENVGLSSRAGYKIGTSQINSIGLAEPTLSVTGTASLLETSQEIKSLSLERNEFKLPKLETYTESQVMLSTRTESATAQTNITAQLQKQDTAQKQIQEQVQEQKQETKQIYSFDSGRRKETKVTIRPVVPIVPIIEPIITPEPPRPPPFKPMTKAPKPPRFRQIRFDTERFESLQPGFNVFVKRAGKLEKINLKPMNLEDAFKKGQFIVGTTARASFKVVSADSFAQEKFTGGAIFPADFYKSKSGFFVEKPERRIKSMGELQEITYKGIATRRGKKKSFNMFRRL
jgi:hypothetical protein